MGTVLFSPTLPLALAKVNGRLYGEGNQKTMNIEKLDKPWLIKCPKDLFGELHPCTKESLDVTIAEHIDKINTLSDYTKGFFLEIRSWAYGAIHNGIYDQSLPYRAKIELTVQLRHTVKCFHLEHSKNSDLFFKKLPACFFEGYVWNDKIRVYRDDEEIDNGVVQYYGTHAASETFSFEKRMRSLNLSADQFEIGDCINIETIHHASIDTFSDYIVQMSSLVGKQ